MGYEQNGRYSRSGAPEDALVAAARDLVERRDADRRGRRGWRGSRAPRRYRYFPNQRAAAAAAHPETTAVSMLPDDAPVDVEDRLEIVVDAFRG